MIFITHISPIIIYGLFSSKNVIERLSRLRNRVIDTTKHGNHNPKLYNFSVIKRKEQQKR
jgi:hypothetical protein